MQKNKIKVIDDFLPIVEFDAIKNHICDVNFPWYWQEYSHGDNVGNVFVNDDVPQLVSSVVINGNVNSDAYHFFEFSVCFSKLNAKKIYRLRLNCNFKTLQQNTGWFHTDYCDDRMNELTTSILYINTNNGGTKFEDGTFVNSVSNRMVIFDCSMKHAPVSCTNKHRRIVANFNYFKNE